MGDSLQASIIAQNEYGFSHHSSLSNVLVYRTVPAAPVNLEALAVGHESFVVGWDASSQDGGSPIIDY